MSEGLSREQLLDYIKKQKLKIKKLETKNAELVVELDKVQSKEADDENTEQLQKKLQTIEKELEDKGEELNDSECRSRNRIESLESEIGVISAKAIEYEEAFTEQLHVIQTLKEGFNEKNSAFEEQVKINADLQSQLLSAQEAMAVVSNNPPLDSSCSQCTSLKERVGDMEIDLAECNETIKAKMKEVESQKEQIASSNKRVGELLTEMSELEAQYSASRNELQSQLHISTAKCETLSEELSEVRARENNFQDKYSKLESKLLDLQNAILEEKECVENVKCESHDNIKKLSTENHNWKIQVDDLLQKVKEITSLNDNLVNERDKSLLQVKNLEEREHSLNNELDSLRRSYDVNRDDETSRMDELKTLKEKVLTLTDRLSSKDSKINELELEIQKLQDLPDISKYNMSRNVQEDCTTVDFKDGDVCPKIDDGAELEAPAPSTTRKSSGKKSRKRNKAPLKTCDTQEEISLKKDSCAESSVVKTSDKPSTNDLELTIAMLQNKVNDMQIKLERVEELETIAEEARSKEKQMLDLHEEIERKLKEKENVLVSTINEKKKLEEDILKKSGELFEIQQQNNELKCTLDGTLGKHLVSEVMNRDLEIKLEEINSELNQSLLAFENEKMLHDDERSKRVLLQQKLEAQSGELAAIENDKVAMEKKLSFAGQEVVTKLEEKQKAMAALEKSFEVSQATIAGKEEEISKLNAQIHEIRDSLFLKQNEFESKKNYLLQQLSIVESDKESLDSNKYKSLKAAHEKQVADLTEQIELVGAAVTREQQPKSCTNCGSLEVVIAGKQTDLQKAESAVSKYKGMVKQKMKEIKDLTDSVQSTQSKTNSLEKENVKLKQQVGELNAALKEKMEEIAALRDSLSSCEERLLFSEKELSTCESKLEEYKARCAQLEESKDELSTLWEKRASDRKVSEEAALHALKKECLEKQQCLIESNNENVAKLERTITGLTEELEAERKELYNVREAMKVMNENYTAKFDKEKAENSAEQQVSSDCALVTISYYFII